MTQHLDRYEVVDHPFIQNTCVIYDKRTLSPILLPGTGRSQEEDCLPPLNARMLAAKLNQAYARAYPLGFLRVGFLRRAKES